MDREESLFFKYDLRSSFETMKREMYSEIEQIERNKFLNSNPDDLSEYFFEKYKINPPKIDEGNIKVEQNEAKIDVRYDFNRFITDTSRPHFIDGTRITYHLPFEGDAELFRCKPSTYYSVTPRAIIGNNEILIIIGTAEHDPEKIKTQFTGMLTQIMNNLRNIENDAKGFNDALLGEIKGRIEQRKTKLLKDQGLAANLGYPIIKRDDASQTYVVPTVKKKIEPKMPLASSAPYVQEPILDMKGYENILSIMSNMVNVMERSPKAFRDMQEEDLRQHFLVQLNGQYEGQATGETFNYSGKTDILIRVDGKNIFIAECKIWKGPESLKEAIDQILGYLSWRDTKTAVILFNRNKNTSKVLANIPNVVKSHKNYKKEVEYKYESGFRFILGQSNDMDRDIYLTILVFDVPAE